MLTEGRFRLVKALKCNKLKSRHLLTYTNGNVIGQRQRTFRTGEWQIQRVDEADGQVWCHHG